MYQIHKVVQKHTIACVKNTLAIRPGKYKDRMVEPLLKNTHLDS